MRQRTADTMSEAIALSSPSGKMSKRAREAAHKRFVEMLWPGGCRSEDIYGEPHSQPTESERLLAQAARLRELAARGMKPRAYIKEAERLESLVSTHKEEA